MKYELKDLLKAVEHAKKEGAITIDVTTDPRTSKLQFTYMTILGEQVTISIPVTGSELWNEIATVRRF